MKYWLIIITSTACMIFGCYILTWDIRKALLASSFIGISINMLIDLREFKVL